MLNKVRLYPRGLQLILAVVVLASVVVSVWLGIPSLRIYRENLHEFKAPLSQWRMDPKNERILVVAPHCDDETLGCAGVIHDVMKAGGQVRVVVATNGDAFAEIVRRLKRGGPKSFIELGKMRQKESQAAMRVLGVKDSDVIFLGYPDRGTSGMWLGNWTPDNLYTSRYTKCSTSPYPNSYRHDAPYCGRVLLADLESIILAYRPTMIYYPHPCDQHSDHWSVHCYVTQALYELNMYRSVRVGMYIVHRGDWPMPQGLHPRMRLVPPAFMDDIGMQWYEYPLTRGDTALKLKAIRAYKSQTPLLGEYMYGFDRRNELFCTYGPGNIMYMRPLPADTEETIWSRVAPCILDPRGDTLQVDMGRGGDIKSVKCYYDDNYIHARVELTRPYSRRLDYRISFIGLPDATASRITVTRTSKGEVDSGATAKVSGNTFDVTLPLSSLGKWDALMVCADSAFKSQKLDRTAWRIVLRDDGETKPLPNPPAADRPGLRTPLVPARKPL